jgi:hypothetical protein
MTAYNVSDNPQSQHIASVHAAAISVAFVSGTLALVALLLGSPLEFGSALALCGTAWIVANFAERLAEQKRTHHRRTLTSTRRPRVSPLGWWGFGAWGPTVPDVRLVCR